MFRDDSPTLPVPAREADPVDYQETPIRDPLDPIGSIAPEDESSSRDLSHLGLVKGPKERNDLAVLGLARPLPRRRKWFGI